MDPELKKLLDKATEMVANHAETKKVLDEIRAWGAENGRLKQAEDAIKQLETKQTAALADVNQKLVAFKRQAYDGNNGKYRGVFGSEEKARTFVLSVMCSVGDSAMKTWAADVLKANHKDFLDSRKDVTGAESTIAHEHNIRIIRLIESYGLFPQRAFRMPMSTDTLDFTRRISGFRAHKTKVRAKVAKQDMQVAPVNLVAQDFDILYSFPNQMNEDALGTLAEMQANEVGLGYAIALDEDGIIGDGSQTYDNEMGIIPLLKQINGVDDGGGLVLSSGGTAAGWGGITKDDVLKLIGQARYVRAGQGRLAGSNEFFWQVLAKIITAAGGVTRTEMQGSLQLSFMGVPYDVTPVMPRSSGHSQIPLLYGDQYQSSTLGDRQILSIKSSTDVYFESKETGVLASSRFAINNHSLGDATTPGPMVGLITPPAS